MHTAKKKKHVNKGLAKPQNIRFNIKFVNGCLTEYERPQRSVMM